MKNIERVPGHMPSVELFASWDWVHRLKKMAKEMCGKTGTSSADSSLQFQDSNKE